MPRSSRRPQKPPEAPSKAWLDSYADAMTLLLAFFVLLFAMSTLDAQKYKAFFEGLNGVIEETPPPDEDGVLDEFVPAPEDALEDPVNFGPGDPPPVPQPSDTENPQKDPVEEETPVDEEEEFLKVTLAAAEDLVELLDDALSNYLTPEDYSVDLEERGVVVRLADHALFASGSAALDSAATDVLSIVAEVLAKDVNNDVEIEGHTDDRPTSSTSFPSNWELSTARASAVLRHMLSTSSLEPTRVAAVGRADTVPLGSNETSEGRSQNRRTEVVVLFPGLEVSESS